MKTNYPEIVERYYDLSKWTLEKVNKFPKDVRFVLGNRISNLVLDIQDQLILASLEEKTKKYPILKTISTDLELLRFQIRLANDLKAINHKSTHYIINEFSKIGTTIGAWMKSVKQSGGTE